MRKVSSTKPTRDIGVRSGGGVSSKKMIYANVLRLKNRKDNKDVQAALEKAQAGRLLFGKN